MAKQPPKNLGINDALRAAGFVRIPAWWVTPDELEVIHRMAHNHQSEVNRIRAKTREKKDAYGHETKRIRRR